MVRQPVKDKEPDRDAPAATCLDPASGLYHRQHFQLSLTYELNRMERSEKPLGLVVIRLPEGGAKMMRPLGSFLKKALRSLDTPAQLGRLEAAALLPECDRGRVTRLLSTMAERYGDGGPNISVIAYGGALARSWEDWTAAKLLARARRDMNSASAVIARLLAGAGPWAEVTTAVVAAERDSLYEGFTSLASGEAGQRRSGRGGPMTF
jgi:GGDEF domain-containing protein